MGLSLWDRVPYYLWLKDGAIVSPSSGVGKYFKQGKGRKYVSFCPKFAKYSYQPETSIGAGLFAYISSHLI